jgi:hypothetical protein
MATPLAVIAHFAQQNSLPEAEAAALLGQVDHYVHEWAWQVRQLDSLFGRCQSPAERLFALACVSLVELDSVDASAAPAIRFAHDGWLVTLRPQPRVENETARLHPDFELQLEGPACARAYIEIDGRLFHTATQDQVERDRKRERTIAGLGHPVLRFTAAEVNRNADACALEALEIVKRLAVQEAA